MADADAWTVHKASLALVEPAETAGMQSITADPSRLPSDVEESVEDMLSDLEQDIVHLQRS